MAPVHPILRLLAVAQERRLYVAAIGIVLEAIVPTVMRANDTIGGIHGIGGETMVCVAVFGALVAGPAVGALLAFVAWALFFPLIAHSQPSTVVALPLWIAVALAAGLISDALLRLERLQTESDRDRVAAHALRTPVATIHGLVTVLTRGEGVPPEPLLRAISDETGRLLESDLFTGDGNRIADSG